MGDILWEMSRGVLALASLYCLVTVSPLLVLEQGTRFLRTRVWVRRYPHEFAAAAEAYIEFQIRSPTVCIWTEEQQAASDFARRVAEFRERQRAWCRLHPATIPEAFFRERGVPPPPPDTAYQSWSDFAAGMAIGLGVAAVCLALLRATLPWL